MTRHRMLETTELYYDNLKQSQLFWLSLSESNVTGGLSDSEKENTTNRDSQWAPLMRPNN